MITLRPAAERGATTISWLDSRHSFSFNRYYDPRQMGFRSLRVINDDHIAPGGLFPTHPHEDMEILTWVLDGVVVHHDSTGAAGEIRPGDAQKMSAGSGIRHSEANGSATEPLHLLQIWILPERRGLQPEYQQRHFSVADRSNCLRLIASRDGREGSIVIHQDADVYNALLDAGSRVEHALGSGRGAWLQVARGSIELNGVSFATGDGAAIEGQSRLTITAAGPAELLLFDLA